MFWRSLLVHWTIFLIQTKSTVGDNEDIALQIIPNPRIGGEAKGLIKIREGSVLNLTCETVPKFSGVGLSWYLPHNHVDTQARYEQSEGDGTSQLVISPVQESDSGLYQCWGLSQASNTHVKATVRVLVETRDDHCQPGQFHCSSGDHAGNNVSRPVCIAARYRCDSVDDCPGSEDEASSLCGSDPCKGKIVCPELDYRCIDPSEYCCDPHTHPDTCHFLYPCCESVIEFSIRSRLSQQYDENRDTESLSSLHSTIYIIIGCLVAFLLIMLSLCIAVYRLHLVRKLQSRGRGAGRPHPPITLHDLDMYFSDHGDYQQVAGGQHAGQHITYNINHGVQIVGAGGPPPYNRDPPPPYMPDVGEDDNNNGDINGNSEMVDANVAAAQAGAGQGAALRPEPPPQYHDYSSDTDTD